jgi:fibronectin type 3 domain-containing protein
VSGSASGTVTLSTNTASGTATISLTGTGAATAYSVDLKWDAPSGTSVPVASYEIFRTVSGGSYSMIGTTSSGTTEYTDSTVADGTTYLYYVVSVDSSGTVSSPSNTWTAVIP